jgi:hypothetical protein
MKRKIKSVLPNIVESKEKIREKFKKLKQHKQHEEEIFSNTFKSISEPLQNIVQLQEKNITSSPNEEVKSEVAPESDEESPEYNKGASTSHEQSFIDVESSSSVSEDEAPNIEKLHELYSTPTGQKFARDYSTHLGTFAAKLLLMHLENDLSNELDKLYGIRTGCFGIRTLRLQMTTFM